MKVSPLSHRHWKVASWVCVAAFLIATPFKLIRNPSGSHEHRQLDNAGIALSLAREVQNHGLSGYLDALRFPRLAQRDLTNGINITEFPTLFAAIGPLHLLGLKWGTWLGSALLFLIAAFSAAFVLPRFWRVWGIQNLGPLEGLVLYFSSPAVLYFSTALVSEGMAFPLFLLGATLFLEAWSAGTLGSKSRSKRRPSWPRVLLGVLLLAIGIATKPPMVVGLLALAVWGWQRLAWRERVTFGVALSGSLTLTGLWYGVHGPTILAANPTGEYSVLIAHFSKVSLLSRLSELSVLNYAELLWRQVQFEHFAFGLGIVFLALGLWRRSQLAIAFLTAFGIAIGLLGHSIFQHAYYFFGLNLFALLVMGFAFQHAEAIAKKRPWILTVLCACALWGILYSTRTQIWLYARSIDWWKYQPALLDAQIKLPSDTRWATDDLNHCPTKLVLAEQVGATAGERLSTLCRQPGYSDRSIAWLVDANARGACVDSAREIARIPVGGGAWLIKLWTKSPRSE